MGVQQRIKHERPDDGANQPSQGGVLRPPK
jgi:hypothetical protein